MTDGTGRDAIFVGGPRDGVLLTADDIAVVEVRTDGLVHRYIKTTKERQLDGRSYAVYNYNGVIDPDGALPGVETPELRDAPVTGE